MLLRKMMAASAASALIVGGGLAFGQLRIDADADVAGDPPLPSAGVGVDANVDANADVDTPDVNADVKTDADGRVRARAEARADQDRARGKANANKQRQRARIRANVEQAADAEASVNADASPAANRAALGVGFAGGDNRLVIRNVSPNSPAARAGLRVGDEIVRLNGDDFDDVSAFVDASGRVSLDEDAEIGYRRDGQIMTTNVRYGAWGDIYVDDDGEIEGRIDDDDVIRHRTGYGPSGEVEIDDDGVEHEGAAPLPDDAVITSPDGRVYADDAASVHVGPQGAAVHPQSGYPVRVYRENYRRGPGRWFRGDDDYDSDD